METVETIDSLIDGYREQIAKAYQRRIALVPAKAGDRELAALILKLVDEQYCNENMSVPFIAERFGMTTARVSTVINVFLGDRLSNLVNERRIDLAKRLLCTDKSVKEIAYECGFNDKFFSRTFRRLTGQTAREFQQRRAA